jgi:hypothetical protein
MNRRIVLIPFVIVAAGCASDAGQNLPAPRTPTSPHRSSETTTTARHPCAELSDQIGRFAFCAFHLRRLPDVDPGRANWLCPTSELREYPTWTCRQSGRLGVVSGWSRGKPVLGLRSGFLRRFRDGSSVATPRSDQRGCTEQVAGNSATEPLAPTSPRQPDSGPIRSHGWVQRVL